MRNLTRLLTLGWIVLQMAMLSGCRTPPIDWDKIGGPPTPPMAEDVVGIWEGTECGGTAESYVRVELWPDGRGILSTCGIRRTSALVFEISWTLSDGELTWRDVKSGYGVFRGFPHSQERADQGLVTSRLRMVHSWYSKTEYVFIREDHLEQMRGTVRRELEDFRRSLAGGPATNHPPAPQPPVTAHPVEDK
jgi:hypothetical protein